MNNQSYITFMASFAFTICIAFYALFDGVLTANIANITYAILPLIYLMLALYVIVTIRQTFNKPEVYS